MSITVQIPSALRRLTAGAPNISCAATNLPELFSVLDTQFPDLKPHLRDEAGETRRFLNVYVNEEDIRFLAEIPTRSRTVTKYCWCLRSQAGCRSAVQSVRPAHCYATTGFHPVNQVIPRIAGMDSAGSGKANR